MKLLILTTSLNFFLTFTSYLKKKNQFQCVKTTLKDLNKMIRLLEKKTFKKIKKFLHLPNASKSVFYSSSLSFKTALINLKLKCFSLSMSARFLFLFLLSNDK